METLLVIPKWQGHRNQQLRGFKISVKSSPDIFETLCHYGVGFSKESSIAVCSRGYQGCQRSRGCTRSLVHAKSSLRSILLRSLSCWTWHPSSRSHQRTRI
eukprot:3402634-Amphidinium_carterae.1